MTRIDEVTEVLSEAFEAYPVMRWVLGEEGDYGSRLTRLVRFFVQARVLRSEPVLVSPASGRIEGVALVSFPGRVSSPPEMAGLRQAVWTDLGAATRDRYHTFVDASAPLAVAVPNVHLNMIGVRHGARGAGVGRILIERVHALSVDTGWSEGVSLTTEDPRNVPLYEHFGYRVVGQARVAEGLDTWVLFRRDGP